jgi:hypothetical protein
MMFALGLKRKCGDQVHKCFGTIIFYNLQWKSLLDMSLVTLQFCHMLMEPNLCCSILITSMVQQIQEVMSHPRGQSNHLLTSGSLQTSCVTWQGGLRGCTLLLNQDSFSPSPVSELPPVSSAQGPKNPQSSLGEMNIPRENKGSFQKSLDQIFEIPESKYPSSLGELFSDMDSSTMAWTWC